MLQHNFMGAGSTASGECGLMAAMIAAMTEQVGVEANLFIYSNSLSDPLHRRF